MRHIRKMTDANRHRVLRGKLSGKNQSHGKKQLADSDNPHWESVLLRSKQKRKLRADDFLPERPGDQNSRVGPEAVKITGEPCIDHHAPVIVRSRGVQEMENAVVGAERQSHMRGGIETAAIPGNDSDDVAAL